VAGSPSMFVRPLMPILSKCGSCPKEWLSILDSARERSSSDSQRPEAGIQVE
jgi:hypothetical protein